MYSCGENPTKICGMNPEQKNQIQPLIADTRLKKVIHVLRSTEIFSPVVFRKALCGIRSYMSFATRYRTEADTKKAGLMLPTKFMLNTGYILAQQTALKALELYQSCAELINMFSVVKTADKW